MFNLSVPATRPTSLTFWKMGAFFRVFNVSVDDIFAVRKKFKIAQAVICSVKVFVIDFKASGYFAVKRFPYQSVNRPTDVNASFTQAHSRIVFYQHRLKRAHRFIATPRFSVLNRKYGRNASVQERCHVSQFSPCFQHFFGFYYLFGSKTFATRNTTYVAKIADFVQSFVPKHGLPLFHGISSLTFRYVMPNHIKGQV